LADAIEQCVERRLRQRRTGRQAHVVDLGHQVAEHGALAAAARGRPFPGLRLEVLEPAPRLHDHGADIPVDLDGHDVLDAREKPLIAQITDCERLGRGAERHQRDEPVLVDIQRQRMLAGYGVSRTAPVSSIVCTEVEDAPRS
jgi:hypothetical protein